jgi:mRNA interferase MazF
MVMHRGEIWWTRLQPPTGSEPGYRRPVLIIQSNDFNASRISTVIVAVLTSNLRLEAAPGNVLLSKKRTKLPKDSVANVSQVVTLDKSFLTKRISKLSADIMQRVDDGLRLVLNL